MNLQDAVLAAEAGVDGILLSNHGGNCLAYYVVQMLITLSGRQLDWYVSSDHLVAGANALYSSLPPVEVLHRLRQQRSDVFDKMEGTLR
jgi:L-lactate dehydrogenase (cytochrome)